MIKDLTPEEIEKNNNRKLTADKIRQILSKVMETPTQSSKRWVWELMQNAKDVPNNAFGEVSIQIELTENELNFRHNGDPFSLSNVMGLIQQVSSKDSTNKDEEITGKFGTGFISTHLLSRVIDVNGYVLHNGVHRRFDVQLDRRGDSSEDLIPQIDTALSKISKIEDESIFTKDLNYVINRKESSFDTCFNYQLETPNSKKWALEGVNDLVNTLPQTIINLKKIKHVEVINHGVKQVYTRRELFTKDGVVAYEVSLSDDSVKQYLTFAKGTITLAAEVESFTPAILLKHSGDHPNLFRDFPLIGSEKFHFPFMLNGARFNPTEDRDSIVLHSEESKEASENREFVEQAIVAAQEFSQWLINNNAINRFVCAFTRMPELKQSWEEFSSNWFFEQQTSWRNKLRTMPLFEPEKGPIIPIEDGIIPEDGETKDLKFKFYDLARPILGSNSIPKRDHLFNWLEVLGPKSDKKQRSTWGKPLSRDLESLAKTIEGFETIGDMLESTELNSEKEVMEWLNQLYKYLSEVQKTELLKEYALIPNQKSVFKKIDKLFLEDTQELIPTELLDILEGLGKCWRGDLIDRSIVLDLNIEKIGLNKISTDINKILKEEDGSQNNRFSVFLRRIDAIDVLVSILKLQPINAKGNDFQISLFNTGRDLLGFDDNLTEIKDIEGFNYTTTIRHFINLLNGEIESSEGLNGLATKLDKNGEETLAWLNSYLMLLTENPTFKVLVENKVKIIPNRYCEFITYDMAEAFGTEDLRLNNELVDILYNLNNKEDWKGFLVHDGVNIECKGTKKFEELANCIENNISRIRTDDYQNKEQGILNGYKGCILDLIEWTQESENSKLVNTYFSGFQAEAKTLLFELTVENSNVGIAAIKLLQDEKSVNLLVKIQDSIVSTEDLEELIDIVSEIGSTEGLKRRAEQIREEKKHREFLYKVGERVEEAIKSALVGFEVKKVSVGPYDLEVSKDGKSYLLEVKSFYNGSNYPFLFAPSQAEMIMKELPNYSVCMIERPLDESYEISINYVKEHLRFAKNLSTEFESGYNDYNKYKEISSNYGMTSKLVFEILGDVRVEVNKDALIQKSKSFDELINEIRKHLEAKVEQPDLV